MYYVYILASRRHGTLYIGVTNSVQKRLEEHLHARCTLLVGKDKGDNLPDLAPLADADVMVVFTRRVQLSDEQLAAGQARRPLVVDRHLVSASSRLNNSLQIMVIAANATGSTAASAFSSPTAISAAASAG